MGYTHYWYQPVGKQIPPKTWAKIQADCKKLIGHTAIPLDGDPMGDRDPIFDAPIIDSGMIRFNGIREGRYETFLLERITPPQVSWRSRDQDVFSFCKTSRQPYDEVVVAVLAVVQEHAGDAIKVTSDGCAAEWRDGIAFASKVLGREVPLPSAIRA